MSNDDFHELMLQVKGGSHSAAEELLSLCNGHVYRAIRRRLNDDMRSQFDSQDFAQAVWASFFTNISAVTDFEGPRPLIAFLTRVAGNKVIDQCRRRFKSKKQDANRERRVDHLPEHPAKAKDPTPSEVAIANEEWVRMVDGQPARTNRIAKMRFEGMNANEIATELGISAATVRRCVDKLRRRMNRKRGPGDSPNGDCSS